MTQQIERAFRAEYLDLYAKYLAGRLTYDQAAMRRMRALARIIGI